MHPAPSVIIFSVLSGLGFGLLAYLGLAVAAVMFAYQIAVLNIHDPAQCLALFKSNGRVGAILFAGLLLALPFA